MNTIDRKIADRDILLGALIANDRFAVAALARKDDLALLRRIANAGITDAVPLAVARACDRGNGMLRIARALGVTVAEVEPHVAAMYEREDASRMERRPGCQCFMWDEDCPEHPNH